MEIQLSRDGWVSLPTITVRQPWVELEAAGLKPVENRPMATRYRGWLGIHAGRYWAGDDVMRYPWVRQGLGLRPGAPGRELEELVDRLQRELPTRALVAVARLVDVHLDKACCTPWGMRYMGDRVARHWRLEDVHRLDEPIENVSGQQMPFLLRVPLDRLPEAVGKGLAQ